MTTATSWISKSPGVCGGEARIRNTRHTIHGLIEWKRQGVSDERLLGMFDPPLTQADLDLAWDYAAHHPQEIERALWLDRAAMYERGDAKALAELLAEGIALHLPEVELRSAFEPPFLKEMVDHRVRE